MRRNSVTVYFEKWEKVIHRTEEESEMNGKSNRELENTWNCSVGHPETRKANDTQVGGQHYKAKTIQPWDFIAANGLGYFEGNIVKYVSRWRDKGGLDDLRKARHYLDKLIELEENAA